jgi:hypothetical protein
VACVTSDRGRTSPLLRHCVFTCVRCNLPFRYPALRFAARSGDSHNQSATSFGSFLPSLPSLAPTSLKAPLLWNQCRSTLPDKGGTINVKVQCDWSSPSEATVIPHIDYRKHRVNCASQSNSPSGSGECFQDPAVCDNSFALATVAEPAQFLGEPPQL